MEDLGPAGEVARIEARVCMLLLALGTLVGAVLWRAGHPWWGLFAGLSIALLHAWVLALEFGLMARVNRSDPAPRATLLQGLWAWCCEVWTACVVFGWRQPFASRREPNHLQAHHQGQRGVLLVHGFVCNRGLWNRWLRRLRAADRPCLAIDLEPTFGGIESYVARIEQAVARLERGTGLAPVVVAHSMGGLAVRAWLAEGGHGRRVHHLVTLGTPHGGTWLGRWALATNARQMRLRSRWLQQLALREQQQQGAAHCPTTCYFSNCDNIVFPASTATLPAARNVHLPGVAHVDLLRSAQPFEQLKALLG